MKVNNAISYENRTIKLGGLVFLSFIRLIEQLWLIIFCIICCTDINKESNQDLAPFNSSILFEVLLLLIQFMPFLSFRLEMFNSRGYNLSVGFLALVLFVVWVLLWVNIIDATNQLKLHQKLPINSKNEILDNVDF